MALGDYRAAATLRAEDLERAARFYSEVLGLKEWSADEGMRMFEAGQGTMISIYARPGMPAPENTTLGFGVPLDQFDAVIGDLRSRGVVLEEYDLPEMGLKTVNGIVEMEGAKAAWFKDTEGNIISVATM
jgi:catechol-2,3-dioxygenase